MQSNYHFRGETKVGTDFKNLIYMNFKYFKIPNNFVNLCYKRPQLIRLILYYFNKLYLYKNSLVNSKLFLLRMNV